MKIPELLRRERAGQKLTLEQVGERIGVSKAYLSSIENGKKRATGKKILKRISDGYNIPYDVLVRSLIEEIREDLMD